jgi:hypothetical protein
MPKPVPTETVDDGVRTLVERLRARDFSSITDDEWDGVAEIVERFARQPIPPSEITRLRGKLVAQHVAVMEIVSGMKREFAVGEPAQQFEMTERRVCQILSERRSEFEDALDEMRGALRRAQSPTYTETISKTLQED